jgi:glycosyltransferase involved in cell wall biosynthesis
MPNPALTVIILTFNSENTIEYLLGSVVKLGARVVVVDSYSTDKTPEIAQRMGADFVQHPFENYSRQRLWSEEYAAVPPGEWLLHLDSDEIPTAELVGNLNAAVKANDAAISGYLMKRLTFFWGRPMRHGHMNPNWHLRLYKSGQGRCEDRLYDQHYVTEGKTAKLDGYLLDLQLVNLFTWTASHNRWSTAEAEEAAQADAGAASGQLKASLTGDLREKKRWVKQNLWYKLPLLARPYFLFFYNFILRGGFLDGAEGFVYHTLQAFWFRFMVDAKILEAKRFSDFAAGRISSEWLRQLGVELSD